LAIAYAELRLNRRIFDGSHMMEVMLQHVEETPKLAPLPQAEQLVLLKALAKKATARYGSCLEFWRALRQALITAGVLQSSVFRIPSAAKESEKENSVAGNEQDALVSANVGTALTELPPDESSLPTVAPDAVPTVATLGTETPTSTPPRRRMSRRLLLGSGLLLVLGLPVILIAWHGLPAAIRVTSPTSTASPDQTKPPSEVDFLPKGCERAAGSKIVTVKDRKVYDRIVYLLLDRTPILFLLIPQDRETDPPPFYITQDKVSNKLFRAFAAANPQAVADSQWQIGAMAGDKDLGTDDRLPVVRVTLYEAHLFARWLGGELPTARQWDKAAGLLDGAKGPFLGDHKELKPGDIALGRENEGPLPVGTAPRDVSKFDCRDMAGNGREWTCTPAQTDFSRDNERVSFVPIEPSVNIRLRGHSYLDSTPYQLGQEPGQQPPDKPRPDISFRVVIELPASP
jgi:hypothetical protein